MQEAHTSFSTNVNARNRQAKVCIVAALGDAYCGKSALCRSLCGAHQTQELQRQARQSRDSADGAASPGHLEFLPYLDSFSEILASDLCFQSPSIGLPDASSSSSSTFSGSGNNGGGWGSSPLIVAVPPPSAGFQQLPTSHETEQLASLSVVGHSLQQDFCVQTIDQHGGCGVNHDLNDDFSILPSFLSPVGVVVYFFRWNNVEPRCHVFRRIARVARAAQIIRAQCVGSAGSAHALVEASRCHTATAAEGRAGRTLLLVACGVEPSVDDNNENAPKSDAQRLAHSIFPDKYFTDTVDGKIVGSMFSRVECIGVPAATCIGYNSASSAPNAALIHLRRYVFSHLLGIQRSVSEGITSPSVSTGSARGSDPATSLPTAAAILSLFAEAALKFPPERLAEIPVLWPRAAATHPFGPDARYGRQSSGAYSGDSSALTEATETIRNLFQPSVAVSSQMGEAALLTYQLFSWGHTSETSQTLEEELVKFTLEDALSCLQNSLEQKKTASSLNSRIALRGNSDRAAGSLTNLSAVQPSSASPARDNNERDEENATPEGAAADAKESQPSTDPLDSYLQLQAWAMKELHCIRVLFFSSDEKGSAPAQLRDAQGVWTEHHPDEAYDVPQPSTSFQALRATKALRMGSTNSNTLRMALSKAEAQFIEKGTHMIEKEWLAQLKSASRETALEALRSAVADSLAQLLRDLEKMHHRTSLTSNTPLQPDRSIPALH